MEGLFVIISGVVEYFSTPESLHNILAIEKWFIGIAIVLCVLKIYFKFSNSSAVKWAEEKARVLKRYPNISEEALERYSFHWHMANYGYFSLRGSNDKFWSALDGGRIIHLCDISHPQFKKSHH